MTKSEIFRTAHSIAKATVARVGNYMIAFSLALKSVYESLKPLVPGVITALSNGFALLSRGHKMTLAFEADLNCWLMHTENAATRAYRSPGVKCFGSLEAVERDYKSWRGVSQLTKENGQYAH